MRKLFLDKYGQGILEYTLVLGLVIGILIALMFTGGNNSLKKKIEKAYTNTGDALESTTNDITHNVFY